MVWVKFCLKIPSKLETEFLFVVPQNATYQRLITLRAFSSVEPVADAVS
jgi:hypothetical protein